MLRCPVKQTVSAGFRGFGIQVSSLIHFQYCKESFTRNLNRTELAHSFLSFLLLLKQLLFSCDITTVTFGKNILPHCFYGFPRNNFSADCCLNRNFEHLAGNYIFQLFGDSAAPGIGFVPVDDDGEGVA